MDHLAPLAIFVLVLVETTLVVTVSTPIGTLHHVSGTHSRRFVDALLQAGEFNLENTCSEI